jgi:hypothetical protein
MLTRYGRKFLHRVVAAAEALSILHTCSLLLRRRLSGSHLHHRPCRRPWVRHLMRNYSRPCLRRYPRLQRTMLVCAVTVPVIPQQVELAATLAKQKEEYERKINELMARLPTDKVAAPVDEPLRAKKKRAAAVDDSDDASTAVHAKRKAVRQAHSGRASGQDAAKVSAEEEKKKKEKKKKRRAADELEKRLASISADAPSEKTELFRLYLGHIKSEERRRRRERNDEEADAHNQRVDATFRVLHQ